MCAHPASRRRPTTTLVGGKHYETEYCLDCVLLRQKRRRARMSGRSYSIPEYLTQFARLPVIT